MIRVRTPLGALALCLALAPAATTAQQQQPSGTLRIQSRIARRHFEAGNDYFRLLQYDDAAREYQRAYDITHQPELLFNVGRAYEAGGNITGAIQAYQAFLDQGAPGIEDPEIVRRALAALRARANTSVGAGAGAGAGAGGEADAGAGGDVNAGVQASADAGAGAGGGVNAGGGGAQVSADAGAAVQQPPRTRVVYERGALSSVGPFVSIGIGAVGVALGALLGVQASDQVALVGRANTGQVPWSPEVDAAYRGVDGNISGAWLFSAVGGAFIAGGILWLALRGPGEPRTIQSAFVAPREGGAVVGIGGSL